MTPLPPSCYEAMACPFCHASQHARFIRRADEPEVFEDWGNVIAAAFAGVAEMFFCNKCWTAYTPEQFCEKVSEVIQAEKETHKFWKRITEALQERVG